MVSTDPIADTGRVERIVDIGDQLVGTIHIIVTIIKQDGVRQ